VDLVSIGERRYVMAPESRDSRWSNALRSGAECELVLSSGTHRVVAHEIDGRDKPPVLREFARRGVPASRGWRRLDDPELRAVGREIPVFLVELAEL
jgi:hypothetical protein